MDLAIYIYVTFLDTGMTNSAFFLISGNSGVSILSSLSIFPVQSQKMLESKVGVRGSGKESMAFLDKDKEEYCTKAFGCHVIAIVLLCDSSQLVTEHSNEIC